MTPASTELPSTPRHPPREGENWLQAFTDDDAAAAEPAIHSFGDPSAEPWVTKQSRACTAPGGRSSGCGPRGEKENIVNRVRTLGIAGAVAVVLTVGQTGPAMAGQQLLGGRLGAEGLNGDKRLVGIDYRVQDGKLYGVGDQGGVYTLVPTTGAATKVSQLSVALNGTHFGVDFNPAADRLRIVSDTGQNLRHNVNAGGTTIADTTLTYPPATAAAAGITAAAYTNNDLDADTATTLYDLDTTLDQVALQSPANSGQLAPVGKLGVDAGADAGFDIHSPLRGGRATDATGYAVLKAGTGTAVYRISLVTGHADRLGALPTKWQVTDLAVALHRR
jgi:hypothetical protein